MIGRTNAGFGGGGGGLRVAVGLTAPSSPRENTVWVKSASAGKTYVFSEAEPGSPSEGLIWFRATAAGIITRANVYTDGAWVAADTYMYLGGAWVQIASAWNGELFDNGNLYLDITGGWSALSGTQTATDPYLTYSAGANQLIFASGKKIDLTNFTQLHVIGRGRGDYTSGGSVLARIPSIGAASAVSASSVTYAAKTNMNAGYIGNLSTLTEEKMLDITNLFGAYYIAAAITESHTGATLGIKKMWLT